MLQPLVEIDLLGGHRLRFHDQLRAALLRQTQDEVAGLRAVLAEHDLAAVRRHAALELFEIVIQIVDGVPLERVGVRAQFLVVRQRALGHACGALVLQAAGGGVEGQLQIGVGQRRVDLLFELAGHGFSGSPEPRPDASCARSTRPASARLESASGSSNRRRSPCPRRSCRMESIFGPRHPARKLRELHGERAAEAAAFLRRKHLAQFETAHLREQPPRRVLDAAVRAARGSYRDTSPRPRSARPHPPRRRLR